MEKFKLQAESRKAFGRAAKRLRNEGFIPAVLYGKGKENLHITINKSDFRQLYRQAGTSSIVNLEIGGEGQKNVLLHEIDYDVMTGDAIHLDFYEVSMTEKITTEVPLKFVGDSPAIVELGGSLVTNKNELEIECLPGNLPHEIEIDISVITDFEKAIHVSDIKVPTGVEVKSDPEEMVVTVEAPRTEEEMAELEEPVSGEVVPEEETSETEQSEPESE